MLTDDLLVVMDSVGSRRVVLVASQECTIVASLFAASYPERSAGLILIDPWITYSRTDGTPWLESVEEWEEYFAQVRVEGPGIWIEGTVEMSPENARSAAALIPGSRSLEFSSLGGHRVAIGTRGRIRSSTRSDGSRRTCANERQPSIVPSQRSSSRTSSVRRSRRQSSAIGLGTRSSRGTARSCDRYSPPTAGREVDTAGDGFFITFDGPARAAYCAIAIVAAVRSLGLEVRAGLHTAEVETLGEKVGGIAVSIGARIAGAAGPSEVPASSTVRDLVAGSGLSFDDAGERPLKGVPGTWHLYRVTG